MDFETREGREEEVREALREQPHRDVADIYPLGEVGEAIRGMKQETLEKFKVTVPKDTGGSNAVEAIYPYFDKDGKHIANKVRFKGKEFKIEGEWRSVTLFGQQLFPAGSAQQITLTEGQDDAMAAFEMQGSRFPCVSVSNAQAAVKDVKNAFEYLNAFDNIVICFDADDAGREATAKVAAMFKPGKCRVMNMTAAKDANEYLLKGMSNTFIKEWWAAAPYKPDGLKLLSEMWDEIKTPRKYDTVPYPWAGLNHTTYGIRLSEFVLITAQTKVGKTAMVKEIIYNIKQETDKKQNPPGIGMLMLEEPNYDTCLGLMSIVASKPLHLPDVRDQVPEAELFEYYKEVKQDRLVVWDHFGSNTIEAILNKIRHMHNMGCKYIFLDHLSIVVSNQSGDERKQLDEISTKLKMLCMELNIAVIAVIHQNRNNQIRSSAGPEQIANITIKLTRDMEDPDEWRRNVTTVSAQYNRFCGRTGPACYLFYNSDTGRLEEMSKEDTAKFLKLKPDAKAEEKW